MQNVNALAIEIREIGKANGFNLLHHADWSGSNYHVPAMLALIHSEIVEAHAEFHCDIMNLDKDALAAEFADIQIRVLDLAGGLTENFASHMARVDEPFISKDFDRAFNSLHSITTAALENFRDNDMEDCLRMLALLFFSVEVFAAGTFDIDMSIAVPAKIDINRNRSHRHGGKRV